MKEWRNGGNVEAFKRLIVVCAEYKNVGAILVVALMLFVYQMLSLGLCPNPLTFFPKELTFGKNKQVCFCSHLIVLLS